MRLNFLSSGRKQESLSFLAVCSITTMYKTHEMTKREEETGVKNYNGMIVIVTTQDELEGGKGPLMGEGVDDEVDFMLSGRSVVRAAFDVILQLPGLGAAGAQSSNHLTALSSDIKGDHLVGG